MIEIHLQCCGARSPAASDSRWTVAEHSASPRLQCLSPGAASFRWRGLVSRSHSRRLHSTEAVAASPLPAARAAGGRGRWSGGAFAFGSAKPRSRHRHGRRRSRGRRVGMVRSWSAGDRLEPAAGQPRRRVTRYLSDVGVRGADRAGWPVVVAGDDVVWIPGVRRSDAATDRSGRPVRHYVCERIDR